MWLKRRKAVIRVRVRVRVKDRVKDRIQGRGHTAVFFIMLAARARPPD